MNVKAVVYNYISDTTGLHNFKDDDSLDSLGMDSLDEIEMLMELESRYCIAAIDTGYKPIKTVNDVICTIETALANGNPALSKLRAMQKKNTSLYTIKQGKPHCCISEEPCKKIQLEKIQNNGLSPCEQANCIIVRNMKKMLAELQKTK